MNIADRRSVLAMLAAVACGAMTDAISKFASQSMPVSQLIFVRATFGCAFLLAMATVLRLPVSLRPPRDVRVRLSLRALLDAMASVCYVFALASLPMANATAIFMATPIFVVVLAIIQYKERVDALRWAAIFAGFAGILLVVQPAANGFNAWSVLVLCSAAFTAVRDLITRPLGREISSVTLSLASTIATLVCAALWGMASDWQPMSARQTMLLGSAGVLVSFGFLFGTIAMRGSSLAKIAPFRYASLIFAAILSFGIWGELPNTLAFCGMVLTVLAGVYLIRRG